MSVGMGVRALLVCLGVSVRGYGQVRQWTPCRRILLNNLPPKSNFPLKFARLLLKNLRKEEVKEKHSKSEILKKKIENLRKEEKNIFFEV